MEQRCSDDHQDGDEDQRQDVDRAKAVNRRHGHDDPGTQLDQPYRRRDLERIGEQALDGCTEQIDVHAEPPEQRDCECHVDHSRAAGAERHAHEHVGAQVRSRADGPGDAADNGKYQVAEYNGAKGFAGKQLLRYLDTGNEGWQRKRDHGADDTDAPPHDRPLGWNGRRREFGVGRAHCMATSAVLSKTIRPSIIVSATVVA